MALAELAEAWEQRAKNLDNGYASAAMTYRVCARELRAAAPRGDSVPMPQNADQAALMVLLGTEWLKNHAPERLNKRQYYYRDNKCEAYNASKGTCICWHDEGTGPLPEGRPGLAWRNKE